MHLDVPPYKLTSYTWCTEYLIIAVDKFTYINNTRVLNENTLYAGGEFRIFWAQIGPFKCSADSLPVFNEIVEKSPLAHMTR